MKTLGLRAIRNNSGLLSASASNGESVVIMNRNQPMSVSIPFDDRLLETGTRLSLAIKLFEEKALTLSQAAKVADLSIEAFIQKLGVFGIVAVDHPPQEIESDLTALYD